MRALGLVDLYVPARLGTPRELQTLAEEQGLDALVLVYEEGDERASSQDWAELKPGRPYVYQGVSVNGEGFRFLCLAPDVSELSVEALESSGDPRLVQSALLSLGGLALPVCLRQGADGTPSRHIPRLEGEQRCGRVSLTVPGSYLGRDLDLEDTGFAGRRVLGASGPFAEKVDLGRYATALPIMMGAEVTPLITCLERGYGIAVECISLQQPEANSQQPSPFEGREQEEGESEDKRRYARRRRRR